VASSSTTLLIVDEDEEEEEELEDRPFRGQHVDMSGDGAIGEDGMDAEGEEDLWSEEGGGQDVEKLDSTWRGAQVGGFLPVR
jgi:hypothetical protein